MLKIIHRINTIEQLKSADKQYGVEIDLRDSGKNIVLNHDPFSGGVKFEEWLKHYQHSFVILNIKSEGIEEKVLEIVTKYNIKRYFLLDLSFPALVKLVRKGERNIAIRFSEYESLETVLAMRGKVNWVWLDCFKKMPLNQAVYKELKDDFKLCLVSPELQGQEISRINEFKKSLDSMEIQAVCTKRPDLW